MLKEFDMVWIILLKVFKNTSHVISIHSPPSFEFKFKLKRDSMNKPPLLEWIKLRLLYW